MSNNKLGFFEWWNNKRLIAKKLMSITTKMSKGIGDQKFKIK